MPQWFVDCRVMAKRAVDHVRSGELAIEPRTHEHMWYFFLNNIQDWCVSRQLWWGHRIPAYRIQLNGRDDEWIVARSIEEAREKAIAKFGAEGESARLEQDSDVLDTWFSSGLLPLSVFVSPSIVTAFLTVRTDKVFVQGWPNQDPVQSPAYPLSVMETGSDILFFWVARMAMLCEEVCTSGSGESAMQLPLSVSCVCL
jgi:valyl-tRNA synthetase